MIKFGIKFNEYYEFGVVATRQEKVSEKKFWIKILDMDSVPKIGIGRFRSWVMG